MSAYFQELVTQYMSAQTIFTTVAAHIESTTYLESSLCHRLYTLAESPIIIQCKTIELSTHLKMDTVRRSFAVVVAFSQLKCAWQHTKIVARA